jgi:hypothetical protein
MNKQMYFCMTMLPFSSFFPSLPQLPMDPTCMVLVLHLMIFIDFSTNFFFPLQWRFLKFFLYLYMVVENSVRPHLPPPSRHSKTITVYIFKEKCKLFNIKVQMEENDVFFSFTLARIQIMNGAILWRGFCKKDYASRKASIRL